MRPLELRVLAAAAVGWPAPASPAPLREALKAVCPNAPRRLNRFIELALLGAWRCAAVRRPSPDCELYLATGRGYVAGATDLVGGMLMRDEPPMPVDFINISGNAAGFYLAQTLGLAGRNASVMAGPGSFESALALAAAGLARRGGEALVGGVDEAAYPLADHRVRLGLPADAPAGEGSGWLLLAAGEGGAVARLRVHPLRERVEELEALLVGQPWVSLGEPIEGLRATYDRRDESGLYDTASAYVLARFLAEHPGERLLHLARDGGGGLRALELLPPV